MNKVLKKLFEQYAKRLLTNKVRPSISEEGILTIPNKLRVEKMAQSLYKDFKEAGVPDNILKTENDIKVFHHKIAEINNENMVNQFDTLMSESTLFNPQKSADVFDLKGNKMKNPKNILGGEELIDPNSEIAKSIRLENESKKLANSMSDAEIKLRGSRPYDTDEQILQRLNKGNKDSLSNMRYEKAVKAEEAKAAADEDYIMKVLDPEDFSKGGRAGYYRGGITKFLKNFFKSKPKKLETVNDFVDKRQFLKDLVGNTEKNKKARELKMLKEAAEETRNNPGFKFKDLDIDKDIRPIFDQSKDRTLNSKGGRAGYYGGGITNMIEPDLSDIGHGGEAMNSRTRVMTPGSQATTSTGLNYLLGEDNDTTRVPYNEGKMVLPQPKPPADPMVELNRVYNLYTKAGPGVSQETKKYLQQDFIQKLNEAEISQEAFMTNRMQNNFADGGRIGFQDGLNFDKAFKKMLEKETEEYKPVDISAEGEKILKEKFDSLTPNETEKEKEEREMFEMVKEFQTLKKNNLIDRSMPFRTFKKMKTLKNVKNKILELNVKYPEKKIINDEGMVNKENLKSAIDEAEADLEISPIDGLTLKRSINTEGEQSVTSGSFDLGNLNFSSDNIEEGKLTSKGNFNFGGIDLSGMVNSNDGEILNTELGFNYDNALKGKMTNSDGYRSTELGLNKTFPISDKFNLNLKGSADTTTFDDKTDRSSDLTPKLSYNDGIFNADISKEILEGGDGPNLGAGVNYNNFYAKGDNLLSEDRSGVIGYQKEFGDKDGDLFFTAGAEKNIFDDEYTAGAGLKYKFADGGPARQGFKMGKRAFLKYMASGVAGIAGLKTGLFGLGKKEIAKSVIAPAAQAANEAAPAHFLKLVAKIKSLGDDTTPKYGAQPREKVTSYKDYTLSEELDSGRTTIQRSKQSEVDYYDEMLMEDVYMSHTPGKGMADETTKGKYIPDEYVEDTSYLRTSGPQKGDVLDTVDGVPEDILKEVGEAVVKKADGGRIGYKLGKKVVETVIKKAGEGKFTKNEVLLNMFQNTIKQSKSPDTKKRFINFIEEIKAKPELSKDPQVWNFFTKGLPKNQKLVVYGDDTVDFWTQSDFGPHNIATSAKFQKKHPYLTKDQAVKIQNMEPEDQIFEMKKLDAIRKRTANATGGLAYMMGQ